jgi:hypothetical protein
MSTASGPARRSPFVPVFLLALSLLAMTGFQSWQLLQQQARLQTLRENQEPAVAETQHIREQLQALTQGTAKLAAAGNQNAQRIIDELARQGVKVTATEGLPSSP